MNLCGKDKNFELIETPSPANVSWPAYDDSFHQFLIDSLLRLRLLLIKNSQWNYLYINHI